MADHDMDEHFVEVVSNVSLANGVFRITLGQQEDEKSIKPVTRLLIPANQLARMLQGLGSAATEISQKVRDKAETEDGAKDDSAAKDAK